MRGCAVTVGNLTISQRNDSSYLIRGDIICVRGGLLSSHCETRTHLSIPLGQSIVRLERWADVYPLTSLIRQTQPVVVSVASLVDMTLPTQTALLFDISGLLAVDISSEGAIQMSPTMTLLDGKGDTVRLQFVSQEQQKLFNHQIAEQFSTPRGVDQSDAPTVVERLGKRYAAVKLRAVGVGSAYHGMVKRLVVYERTSLELNVSADSRPSEPPHECTSPPPDLMSWGDLRRVMGDSKLLQTHTGRRLVVRCSLNGLTTESDLVRDRKNDISREKSGVDMRRNIAVFRDCYKESAVEAVAQEAEGEILPSERVIYRDMTAVLGEPTDSVASDFQLEVLRVQMGVTCAAEQQTTLQSATQHHHYYHSEMVTLSCTAAMLSMPFSYIANSNEFRAVLHDPAISRLLCGIPAALVAIQLEGETSTSVDERPQFDYVGAVSRLLDGLKQTAVEGADCWAVLQLHPVADENGMLMADCVLALEHLAWC